MLFSKSVLLAALSSSAVAHRVHGHARRQAIPTTTVTELVTVAACAAIESSTPAWSSSAVVTPTPTPEYTSTPAPEESTSTPTPTPESTSTPEPTTSAVPTTSSVEIKEAVEITTSSTSTSTSSVVVSTSTSSVVVSTSTSVATSTDSGSSASWTEIPSDGVYSTSGFGTATNSSGSGDTYSGNVGSPYGSNIISVSADVAYTYKYVVEFTGSNTDDWLVVIWNKYSSDGTMDGWYGKACHKFTLAAGETKYYAFDYDSQGGWAAAKGSSIPTDDYGGYASTWGEFDFGSTANSGWSGFDVSAIMAQDADLTVQGMKICDAYNTDGTCSYITTDAGTVHNAYTSAETDVGGIGGNLSAGPVRLSVVIDYDN
ncbi:hypothetical protein N7520_001033 [Penicillium odoratum]|uniref:uncharacterized protein n=1 Tax=Penicillium odoratum TaxID=1167516 RepID=UPI0025469DA3|nr:uncharacterized protein N7520_001033 [Penicillium odoratum]KAJ5777787.1 hypothetical protein N7520_001033 [Penicillium odoratum]